MMYRIAVGASLAIALLAGSVMAGDALQSGPQPGTELTPFEPLNVTGAQAGQHRCLV